MMDCYTSSSLHVRNPDVQWIESLRRVLFWDWNLRKVCFSDIKFFERPVMDTIFFQTYPFCAPFFSDSEIIFLGWFRNKHIANAPSRKKKGQGANHHTEHLFSRKVYYFKKKFISNVVSNDIRKESIFKLLRQILKWYLTFITYVIRILLCISRLK